MVAANVWFILHLYDITQSLRSLTFLKLLSYDGGGPEHFALVDVSSARRFEKYGSIMTVAGLILQIVLVLSAMLCPC